MLLLAGKGTALFVARGVSVWLGLRVVFGFLFLFLFLWMDEAGKPSLAPWCRGLPVKAGIFGINMCVFVGSCNAEKLVFGRFKAEPPPFGIRLGFRCDSLGSSAAQVSSLINRVSSSGTAEMPWFPEICYVSSLIQIGSFSCHPRN